ncbi:MAG: glycine cleavage system protein GcvH [Beijerinckiaceae bacterium]|jgi:glycine cleavage system H protein|nr:glycine cleavage system protein GcvH [Beijerinckiaceae bacterium]
MAGEHFTDDHEFVRVEGDEGVVGISAFAQEQLGDIVFVELPETGKSFKKGDQVAVVESVKAASEIYMPVDGEIIAINKDLDGEPGVVNSDPLGAGWFFRIRIADNAQVADLKNETAYAEYLTTLE